MATLTYLVATSLDGNIARDDGDTSDFPMGPHVDRLLERWPETFPAPYLDSVGATAHNATFDTVVMGSATYALGLDAGLASPYPSLDQWVCSRTLPRTDAPVHVTDEDPVALVDRLKTAGRRIWLCGGGALASTLAEQIDRLVLKQNPIVIGGGVPLFRDRTPSRGWQHESSEPIGGGVVVATYTAVCATSS